MSYNVMSLIFAINWKLTAASGIAMESTNLCSHKNCGDMDYSPSRAVSRGSEKWARENYFAMLNNRSL